MAEISEISLGAGQVPIGVQASAGKQKTATTIRLSTGRKSTVPLIVKKRPALIAKTFMPPASASTTVPAPVPAPVPTPVQEQAPVQSPTTVPTAEQALQPQPQYLAPVPTPQLPASVAPSTTVVTGSGNGSGGGGGGEEPSPTPAPVAEEKKSMLPWVLLGVLGLGTLYVVTRKQDDKRT